MRSGTVQAALNLANKSLGRLPRCRIVHQPLVPINRRITAQLIWKLIAFREQISIQSSLATFSVQRVFLCLGANCHHEGAGASVSIRKFSKLACSGNKSLSYLLS